MDDMIKLTNGEEISWENFSKWTLRRQRAHLANPSIRSVETPLGIFPSVKSAAAAHQISEFAIRYKLKSEKFIQYRYLDDFFNQYNQINRSYESISGENNALARRVMTPLGPFGTLKSAAEALEISIKALNNRCKSLNFNDYYYLESKIEHAPRKNPGAAGKNSGKARKIMTPIGAFDTVTEAHKALGVDITTIYRRMGNKAKYPDYYYL